MTELLTAAQMRAIEKAAIDSGKVTGLELMEWAGRGVVEAIFEEWPELGKRGSSPSRSREYLEKDEEGFRAVVLCGPGNNGGDGFVVARLLRERGWAVEVFLYGDPEKLPPDARVNYERWVEMGEILPLPEGTWSPHCDLHIDALFGTGLTREIPKAISYSLSYLHKHHAHFVAVAVDTPSGLCADSGRALGVSGKADLTVTFHRSKVGHYLSEGPTRSGKIAVKDIGLPVPAFKDEAELLAWVNNPKRKRPSAEELKAETDRLASEHKAVVRLVAVPATGPWAKIRKGNAGHKYAHGHALILSGGSGKTGAARLAARGALRIGAGLVTLGVPPSAQMEVAEQITALMLRRVENGDGLAEVLKDERLNALCLGPGLGVERARELVPVVLRAGRAAVLDADALSAFADAPDQLFGMLHETSVLTPHGGEFARLFPDIADKLNETPTKGPAYSKVDATLEAARRAGCVVLFKGPDTVIAAPDGRCSINSAHYERAAPWLATAGSGDVLAGFITGLLARGIAPMQAAETAAWLHVECAREFGPGLIAEDLPEQLPAVFRKQGL
ncbi:NAD(P)H-hydrate dehydratase [Ruegeria sp. HKCCD8929]|uniref:NAD(P)H-hydrate dehydratase n=1 Tax=Ruegeria sp. HKCCD8929 TaxID=2683006 RepID=UPI001489C7C0|nr:NAD(P)H-hydrate dehydratase [Ruegeria sp. HKCCD8929]